MQPKEIIIASYLHKE